MCSVLGLCVQQSDPRLRDAGVRVYIANHVTQFDHNVINLLTSCNTVRGWREPPWGPEGSFSRRRAQRALSEPGVALVSFGSHLSIHKPGVLCGSVSRCWALHKTWSRVRRSRKC